MILLTFHKSNFLDIGGVLVSFYRGYIKLNEDKTPVDRRMSRYVPDWPTVGGVLGRDYMIVDIDTSEDADLFMQLVDIYKWKTHIVATDSGIHAIFKKPDMPISSVVGRELFVGIRADYKIGRANWRSSDYECIIKHGKDREVLQQCDDPQILPWQLMCFTNEMDLKHVGEGSGRHGVHQQLIARATAYTADAEEIRFVVQWINDNIFDEPRESVNWSVKQIASWIETNVVSKVPETPEELAEFVARYDVKDYTKIVRFISSNYEVLQQNR